MAFAEFPDHHWFTPGDLRELVQDARAAGAEGLITTEKDWVRLRDLPPAPLPLWVLPVRLVLESGQDHWTRLLAGVLSAAPAGPPLFMSAAIVVRTPNWLGDTVMALPMLAALRAAEPGARITLVGRWATLLAGQGVADVVLPYPRSAGAAARPGPRARGRARRRGGAPAELHRVGPGGLALARGAARGLRHRRAQRRSSPTRCRCPRRACTRWTSTRRSWRRSA